MQQHKRFEVTLTRATEEQAKDFDPRSKEVDRTGIYTNWERRGFEYRNEFADSSSADPEPETLKLVLNVGYPYLEEEFADQRLCASSYLLSTTGQRQPIKAPFDEELGLDLFNTAWIGEGCTKLSAGVMFDKEGKLEFELTCYDDSDPVTSRMITPFLLEEGKGKALAVWKRLRLRDRDGEIKRKIQHITWTYFYVSCTVGDPEECTSACASKYEKTDSEEGDPAAYH